MHLLGEEFQPAIGRDALDWKRRLLDHAIERGERVGGGPPTINAEDLVAAAIVYCRILVDAWRDLADVHLNLVAGKRATVTPNFLQPPARPLENLNPMAHEHAMDRIKRKRQIVMPDQLIAELFDAELSITPQREDQHFLFDEYFPAR